MSREVVYAPGFEEDVERLPRNPVCTKQARKKIAAIIRMPDRIGKQTVTPSNTRHVEVCSGFYVIFWKYDPASDIVEFLVFESHKKAFGLR